MINLLPLRQYGTPFKLFARTSLISYINRSKADSADAFDKAVAELTSTEQEYAYTPSPATADLLKLKTRHLTEKVVNQLQFERARQKLSLDRSCLPAFSP